MNGLDVDAIDRDTAMRSCGVCGEDAEHFRACADCKCTIARCDACGGNKAASREMHLHHKREHGVQMQLLGTETPADAVLEEHARPVTRGDCEPCNVCQAYANGEHVVTISGILPCGHQVIAHANHCRPCPWVSCRHHALLEIAKAKPRSGEDGQTRDARPTTIRLNRASDAGKLGRRSGLHAQDSAAEIAAWVDDAVDYLAKMPETCTLDVADAHTDGCPLVDVAEILGVTTAAIKEEVGPAGEALREGLAEYRDHEPQDRTSSLARLQE